MSAPPPPRCRILIVSNIPTPNNDALFAALARQPGVELHVAYCAEREPNRAWDLGEVKQYPCTFLSELTVGPLARFNPGIVPLVRRFAPAVVVLTGGYVYPTAQLLAWWLTVRRTRWYYWAEELTWPRESLLRRAVRALLRRPLRYAHGILAIGGRSAASFRRLGIDDRKIHLFRYYADTAHFELSPDARIAERSRVRGEHGLPSSATVLLFMGQLIHRKGLDILLRAFARIPGGAAGPLLLIVGDGPLRAEVRALASELGVAERTRFAGFVDPAELPSFTAAADAIVVPSRKEGWGLVVSEGLAAGLPVVASDQVNAAVDLLTDGESGFIFPVDEVAVLAAILARVAASPDLRRTIVARSRPIAEGERTSVAAGRLIRLVCDSAAPDGVT